MIREKGLIYCLRSLLVSLRELWFEFCSSHSRTKMQCRSSLRRCETAPGAQYDKEEQRYPKIDIETRSRMLRIRKSQTIHQVANWGDSRLRTESICLLEVLCRSKARESAGSPDHTDHGDACTTERESTTSRIHLSCEGVLGDQFLKREDWSRNHIP
jgi:hypothetical protein